MNTNLLNKSEGETISYTHRPRIDQIADVMWVIIFIVAIAGAGDWEMGVIGSIMILLVIWRNGKQVVTLSKLDGKVTYSSYRFLGFYRTSTATFNLNELGELVLMTESSCAFCCGCLQGLYCTKGFPSAQNKLDIAFEITLSIYTTTIACRSCTITSHEQTFIQLTRLLGFKLMKLERQTFGTTINGTIINGQWDDHMNAMVSDMQTQMATPFNYTNAVSLNMNHPDLKDMPSDKPPQIEINHQERYVTYTIIRR